MKEAVLEFLSSVDFEYIEMYYDQTAFRVVLLCNGVRDAIPTSYELALST